MHPDLTHLLVREYQSECTGRTRPVHRDGFTTGRPLRSPLTRVTGTAGRVANATTAGADRLRAALMNWRLGRSSHPNRYLAGTSDRRSR
jgi:hypothetical protein